MAALYLSKRALSRAQKAGIIEKQSFGTTKCGKNVDLFSMRNANGMSVEIINYGAHLRSVNVPDREKKSTEVTIGLSNIRDYEERNDYFGCIAGRFANRIDKGQFKLNKKPYQLSLNDGVNSLHGGIEGFNKKVWNVTDEINDFDKIGVALNYISADGEEGYPSICDVTCKYLLYVNENILEIVYDASTDNETIFNVTNHAYWNLNGNFSQQNAICDGSHELMIHSSFITPIEENMIPNGDLFHVNDSAFDFKRLSDIGSRINDAMDLQIKYGKGYDHNYVINNDGYKNGELMTDVATLKSNENGIELRVDTTQPGLQFYSGNFLDATKKTKNGQIIQYRSALCLETQHFPDSPNKVNFPSTVLKKDKPFTSKTRYKFSAQ